MDEQQEEELIEHFIHEHPLKWIPNVTEDMSRSYYCYSCWRDFARGEPGYVCSVDCNFKDCLHEECGEIAREIRHPMHPPHPLTQVEFWDAKFSWDTKCSVCDLHWDELGSIIYICSVGCEMFIHIGCAAGDKIAVDDDQVINHTSHPQHQLRFLRRKKRSCTFDCDACGTPQKGNSYICSICQYWIHESCATLLTKASFQNHHPEHYLSLAFTLPVEYIKYKYSCGICTRSLPIIQWVYHCQLCRYVIHIKCATITSIMATSKVIENENADILKCPTNDVYEDVIKAFVKREKGEILIPYDDNQNITSYKFDNHKHPLRFISFSVLPSTDDNKNEEDDDDDDDEGPELTCDGCAMTIHQNPPASSSSSSSSHSYDNDYMSCVECEYFLHLACFNLPQYLSSHPCHRIKDHLLNLRSGDGKTYTKCDICYYQTTGLFYACTICYFQIDIKCISLPDTIKHEGHPHDLKLSWEMLISCFVCEEFTSRGAILYKCDKCTFFMCCGCALLPPSNKHRLEKHVLPLTYNASVNHPDEFYCANCETLMNPRMWMYHCRDCDQSFHPRCIPAKSGVFKNFNFGMQLYHTSHHPKHSLRFQIISKKKRCDICPYPVYDSPGYQCTSCNFVICDYKHTEDVKPINRKNLTLL